jgi:hypothetical protein
MFPKLRPEEIDRLRRFGEVRRYATGNLLFVTGEPSPGMFVLIAGTVAVTARDGLGHVVPIVEQGLGEFLAEVGQLSGRPALVDARAKTEIEALPYDGTAGVREFERLNRAVEAAQLEIPIAAEFALADAAKAHERLAGTCSARSYFGSAEWLKRNADSTIERREKGTRWLTRI